MVADIAPLEAATRARKLVSLNYSKKTTGETVAHTVGIQEIGASKAGEPCIWGWDVALNDNIRCFLLSNILDFQVLDSPFIPNGMYPVKINGEIV